MLDKVAEEFARTGEARLQVQSNALDMASDDLAVSRLQNVHSYLQGRGVPEAAIASGKVAITFGREP